MMNKTLYGVLFALRWLSWLIKCVFIWPAAMLMLLLIMMFWLDNTTPGTLMAEEIASVSKNAQTGEYRIPLCPERKVDKDMADVLAAAPTNECRDTVLTNAEGYAAHIDSSLRVLQTLWVTLALIFVLVAFFLGYRPYSYWPYRPGVKLAATPVTVEESKKGGRHE
ncbi:conjugal transfer protein TraP [Klebsiella michiganensis]|uniref:conjugal transfer protein TraP n=1 Tax=Klebsiella michiganensis TaxID=1134687 RepID=UPI002238ADAB|nr:conjugal transfer protein TraP [Klebsiella michiganensis]MCW6015705.1 conjugal transfer protein TraP [Serratia marcescens]MDL4454894.1 conjugal transfer protein TraP [Klebsiella michiganensis]